MTPSPAARAEAHSQTHLVEQVRDVASRVADVDDHVMVHLAADALDAQARLIEEAREVIVAAERSLTRASRMLTEDHKIVLHGRAWGGVTLQRLRAFLATLPAKTGNALSPRSVDERESQE
jgi:hypothetical protein